MSQKFDLSTILGLAMAVLGVLQHVWPDQPWIGQVAAGLTAIVLQESKAALPSPVPPTSP